MNRGPGIPDGFEAITAAWMQSALAGGGAVGEALPAVQSVTVEDIGGIRGAAADARRCRITYGEGAAGSERAPRSVIVKRPSPRDRTRATGMRLSLYLKEYHWYERFAAQIPIRSPALYYGAFEPDTHNFVLLLEDLAGMQIFNESDGADAARVRRAVRSVARMHAHSWSRLDRAPYPEMADLVSAGGRTKMKELFAASLRTVLDRYGAVFSKEMRDLAGALGASLPDFIAETAAGPQCFSHGDFRLENMFFGIDEPDVPNDVALIDWQTYGINAAMMDVSYFLGGSLPVDLRRSVEREAVAEYHEVLCRNGVEDLDFEECWRLYRRSMLIRLTRSIIIISHLALVDERSRLRREDLLRRTFSAVEDLDSREFLPAGG